VTLGCHGWRVREVRYVSTPRRPDLNAPECNTVRRVLRAQAQSRRWPLHASRTCQDEGRVGS
jgi:hypothetical protein